MPPLRGMPSTCMRSASMNTGNTWCRKIWFIFCSLVYDVSCIPAMFVSDGGGLFGFLPSASYVVSDHRFIDYRTNTQLRLSGEIAEEIEVSLSKPDVWLSSHPWTFCQWRIVPPLTRYRSSHYRNGLSLIDTRFNPHLKYEPESLIAYLWLNLIDFATSLKLISWWPFTIRLSCPSEERTI